LNDVVCAQHCLHPNRQNSCNTCEAEAIDRCNMCEAEAIDRCNICEAEAINRCNMCEAEAINRCNVCEAEAINRCNMCEAEAIDRCNTCEAEAINRCNMCEAEAINRTTATHVAKAWGWPEPYICTVYDRIFGDFPCHKHCIYTVHIWFWPTLNMFTVLQTCWLGQRICTHAHMHVPRHIIA